MEFKYLVYLLLTSNYVGDYSIVDANYNLEEIKI